MKIRIQNFRCFDDTGFIDIKPITVLLGRNSSGKSTFLRTFPMLKQSFEERTRVPILLWGRYVDFGTNVDVKPHFVNNDDKYSISFILDEQFSKIISRYRSAIGRRLIWSRNLDQEPFRLKYKTVFEEGEKDRLHICKTEISMIDNNISIEFNNKKNKVSSIKINKEEYFNENDNLSFYHKGEFSFNIFKLREKSVKVGDETDTLFSELNIQQIIRIEILKLISKYVNANTLNSTKWEIINGIHVSSDKRILEQLKNISYPTSFNKNIKSWNTKTSDFIKLKNLILLHKVFEYIIVNVNDYLKTTFLNTTYIAPLRATAERYYRIQHLAVNEVDPNGQNLPVFLDSLTGSQMRDFATWTNDNFGFKVKIHKTEGHYSIKVIQVDGIEVNLSDMGFGYSQILPILTQLWYSSSKFTLMRPSLGRHPRQNTPKVILIEQPELHLHPEFQAKFAESIVKVINYSISRKNNLRIVLETHSDTIVNRLGDCIINSDLDPELVNLVIFDKKDEKLPVQVSESRYDSDGNLVNWPLGFFQPEII